MLTSSMHTVLYPQSLECLYMFGKLSVLLYYFEIYISSLTFQNQDFLLGYKRKAKDDQISG